MHSLIRNAVVEFLESRRLLSAGDLDPTFSVDGLAAIDLPGSSNEFAAAAQVRADGRVVIAGRATVGTELDFFVAQLNASGTLDTSFGGGDGVTFIDFQVNDEATDLVIDDNGRIVVVGTSSSGAGSNARRFAVARLTSTGLLDPSFSADGKALIDFGTNADAQAVALHGSLIYVGGYKDLGATGQFALARLLSTGAPDTSYSGDGEVFFGFGGNNDSRAYDIAIDAAGQVVMVGYDENFASGTTGRNAAYAVVGTNGLVNTNFSGDGIAVTDINGDDEARAVAIDVSGRIITAGFSDGTGGSDFFATRLTASGALDSSFSTDGRFSVNIGGIDTVESVAVMEDLSLRISGSTSVGGFQAVLVQVNANGTLDTSFGDGGDGIQTVNTGVIETGFALAVDPRGRQTVLVGTDGFGRVAAARLVDLRDHTYKANASLDVFSLKSGTTPGVDGAMFHFGVDQIIRKYRADGSIDPSFGAFDLTSLDQVFLNMLVADSSSRLYVVSNRENGSGVLVPEVRRLTATGELDLSYGIAGVARFSFADASDDTTISQIKLDGSNRLVLLGRTEFNAQFGVARLTPGGLLDSSFSGDGLLVETLTTVNVASLHLAVDVSNRVVVLRHEFSAVLTDRTRVFRYTAAGVRDNTFAGNGNLSFQVPGAFFFDVNDIDVDPQSRVIIGGTLRERFNSDEEAFIVRLTTAGAFDNSFSGDGLVQLKTFTNTDQRGRQVIADDAGNYWVYSSVRNISSGGVTHGLFYKLLPSGALASDFSGDGIHAVVPPGADLLDGFVLVDVEGAVTYGDLNRSEFVRLNVSPEALTTTYLFETMPLRVQVTFNDDVGQSLTDSDLTFSNTTAGGSISTSLFDVTQFNPLTNTATLTFNGGFVPPDGNWNLTISAAGTTNRQGMNLAGDRVKSFFALAADATRDRAVNLDDFTILAANFGQTGRVFSQGNFNYDPAGAVNLDDFTLLAAQFGKTLASAGETPRRAPAGAP
ncbi:MAG TPA: hypothetical protein PLD59_14065, partial [Tepidisphaeraceae bacterium]|nr:hypothetical protein [Tepidisphaeraceae bacterium]